MGPAVRPPVATPPRPATFDAGGLIAIERGDARVRALTRVLIAAGAKVHVPAPALAEVWRGGAGRQARLGQLLSAGLDNGHFQVVDLDLRTAREIGLLLGRAPMSITDAAVCHSALLTEGTVVTSDPRDIGRLIPASRIAVV